jgi:hypothetical protein
MACTNMGPFEARESEDEDGHVTVTVKYKVRGTPGVDGPHNARNCPTLPQPGSPYVISRFSGEYDLCCWCRRTTDVEPAPETKPGERPEFWYVTKVFSSKPTADGKDRCADSAYCDPTEEPQKIRIRHSDYTEEASYDRFGRRILSSSHEPIHGPNNEWVFTRTTVSITQNVTNEQHSISLIEQMKDTVNALPLWGLPPRTIKFKPGDIERHFRMVRTNTGTGVGDCECYWTRELLFEIKYRRREVVRSSGSSTGTGIELTPLPGGPYESWDRDVWDEGTRVLRGYWGSASGGTGTGTGNRSHWVLVDIDGAPPDPDNPHHFIRFKDWNGENTRTLLDGFGKPAFVPYTVNQWWVVLETYQETGGESPELIYFTHKFYMPCGAALKEKKFLQNAEVLSVRVFGPYDSEAEADSAIDSFNSGGQFPSSLGTLGATEIENCDQTPSVGVVHIEKYGQSDLLLLGIPTDFCLPLPPYTNP